MLSMKRASTCTVLFFAIATSTPTSAALLSGTISINQGLCSMSCLLSLDVTYIPTSSDYTLTINSASTSGSFLCNTPSFSGFPSTDVIHSANWPSDFIIPTSFSTICGTCSNGNVAYTYDGSPPMTITPPADPNCNISGNLY